MSFWELMLISIGLSMDAFAVALCKGLAMPRLNMRQAAVIAIFFGGFQALMPLLGWLLGRSFQNYITAFDHWIAFGLLLFIGGRMIYEARQPDAADTASARLSIRQLLLLSIATSIDALAVGVTFAFLQTDIVFAVSLIGVTTFILSLVGVAVGHRFGVRYKNKAEIAGGVVLILIGVKILLEHLGILG